MGTMRVIRVAALVAAVALASATACSAGYTSAPEGSAGGPCYGNGTCNTGLTCASSLCVSVDAGVAVDASTNDAASAFDGSIGRADAGGGETDGAGADGAAACELKDGTYSVTTTGMDAPDYDGGLCKGSVSSFTWPNDGGLGVGCVASDGGCTLTCDSMKAVGGSSFTTKTHVVLVIASDGSGYSANGSSVTTDNQNGNVLVDCLYTEIAKLQ
jgi:hypothetical protein